MHDCFDVPKVRFDHVRQRFYPLAEALSIHATAQVNTTTLIADSMLLGCSCHGSALQDRFHMYLDRLLLLHQRLRRDKAFSRPALTDADISEHSTYCQVVKALLGHSSETVFKLSEVALVLLVLTSCRYPACDTHLAVSGQQVLLAHLACWFQWIGDAKSMLSSRKPLKPCHVGPCS